MFRVRLHASLAAATAVAALSATLGAQPTTFHGLGFLSGPVPGAFSGAAAISADGTTVVGGSSNASLQNEPFRWTAATGLVGLGMPPSSAGYWASDVSADGSVVAGISWTWTAGVGYAPATYETFAISGDGLSLVGRVANLGQWCTGQNGVFQHVEHHAYWQASPGAPVMQLRGASHGSGQGSLHGESTAAAISRDGLTVVGGTWDVSCGGTFTQACLWHDSGAPTLLGVLPGSLDSYATSVSADGSVVVGTSRPFAFLWTAASGMVSLGNWTPTAVSGDGSVVVGYSTEGGLTVSFIWDAIHGVRELHAVLAALGVDPSGWDLGVSGVSGDGRTIVGTGTDPAGLSEGWVAFFSDPVICGSADFNCDGDMGTDADIEAFFACLGGTCPPAPCTSTADFNADGDIGTDADIESFFHVLAGGPC